MQKLPIAIALASLMAAVVIARTQQNGRHPSNLLPTKSTPIAYVTNNQQTSLPQHEESPTMLRSLTSNPIPVEVAKGLSAEMVPYGNAVKRARELLSEGQLVAAEAECRRALTLVPLSSGKPWYGAEVPLLGDILMAQGRYEEALECYLNEVANQRYGGNLKPDDPDHPTPNLNAALAYCRLGNFEMAKTYYPEKVIVARISPEQWPDWPGIGDIRALEASLLYIRGGEENSTSNYRRALFYTKQAAKLAPKNWLIANGIGQILYDMKRYNAAVPYYRRAMQLGGDKVSYDHRMRVEMYDLQQKQQQNKQKAPR